MMIPLLLCIFEMLIVSLNCPPFYQVFFTKFFPQFLLRFVEILRISITYTMATLSLHRNGHRKNVESTHEIQQIFIETRRTTCNYITNYNDHVSKV